MSRNRVVLSVIVSSVLLICVALATLTWFRAQGERTRKHATRLSQTKSILKEMQQWNVTQGEPSPTLSRFADAIKLAEKDEVPTVPFLMAAELELTTNEWQEETNTARCFFYWLKREKEKGEVLLSTVRGVNLRIERDGTATTHKIPLAALEEHWEPEAGYYWAKPIYIKLVPGESLDFRTVTDARFGLKITVVRMGRELLEHKMHISIFDNKGRVSNEVCVSRKSDPFADGG